jgi:hypothetical protein
VHSAISVCVSYTTSISQQLNEVFKVSHLIFHGWIVEYIVESFMAPLQREIHQLSNLTFPGAKWTKSLTQCEHCVWIPLLLSSLMGEAPLLLLVLQHFILCTASKATGSVRCSALQTVYETKEMLTPLQVSS